MPRISFLDCPHKRIQQYTECCLDCGYNIYITKEEYLSDLQKQLARKGKDKLSQEIRAAEAALDDE